MLSYSCGLEETTGAGIEVFHKAKDLRRTMKVLIRWKYDLWHVDRDIRVRYPPIVEGNNANAVNNDKVLERMGVEGGKKTFHKLVRFPTRFNDYILPR